jgi:predicted anti-sigma-YlaC factor YlaD
MMPVLISTILLCTARCQETLWLLHNNRFDLIAGQTLGWLKDMVTKRTRDFPPTESPRQNIGESARRAQLGHLCGLVLIAGLLSGCSIRQSAVNIIGDALSNGSGVFASDDDPELIREALPFGLKFFESLLEVSPDHRGLLLAAARGFTAYAFLLQDRADRFDENDLRQAQDLRARARNLYLRGRNYALRGIEARFPGFTAALRLDRDAALERSTTDEVPYLYWAGAAWAGALSAAKNNPDLLVDLPVAGALVARVLDLDETYDSGAAHEFFISFEAGRPGGNAQRAREHYRRAVELSRGQKASVYVALAESVAVREQKLSEFRNLLEMALTIEINAVPEWRLPNAIAMGRAAWLQGRAQELFLEVETQRENPS